MADGTQLDQDDAPPALQHFDFVVFYSDRDCKEAYRIAEFLEHERNGNFRGFLDDRNGRGGATDIENLDYALENCTAYIILLSQAFLQSNFQTFTMHTSLHTSVTDPVFSNRLLPLLVDVNLSDIPSSLRIIQGIPYCPDDDRFWVKLQRSLESICCNTQM